MPRLTDEQIRAAREINLLSWMQAYEPHELKPDGPHYRTVTHGSLVIRNDGRWYWNRGGIGGVSALDFMIKMRGMGFVEAVETLSGVRAAPAYTRQEAAPRQAVAEKKDFLLPPASRCGTHAMNYLLRRGISSKAISRCLSLGIFYESQKYHNCVFVGMDDTGKARFAAQRSVGGDFKKDVYGSDKRFSFCLPPEQPGARQVAVFEAPLDALSHATLQERDGWKWNGHRLSLGGTSHVALTAFLERHPEIQRVVLHLDNDRAGLVNARKIKAMLKTDERFSHVKVSVNPPHRGKDYNQDLQNRIRQEREQQSRQKQAAISL